MNAQSFEKWIQAGDISIPRALLMHYKDIGLNDLELLVVIQLKSFLDQGDSFPQIQQIADRMHLSHDQVFSVIHQLIKKKVLQIQNVVDEDGKASDEYQLTWLYEKLFMHMQEEEGKRQDQANEVQIKELYSLFEQEFSRPLSAIEIETLNAWIDEDKYSPDLIYLALREAVLNQVYSLKYIDRILLNWEKKNLKTKDQVEKESKRHRQNQTKHHQASTPRKAAVEVPLYNWLEDYQDTNNS